MSPTVEQGSDVITQAEPSSTPFEVAIVPNGDLPAVRSTEWQLIYPAGGSTHPSYPWPSTDPRLTFHAHFVPLKNGIPDATLVPPLVLPTGWRHATWCGLHPVVFDPYQQAFKLTPIGPLPLTSEELHQGGLQDYVPGGRLHPEAELLPILSSFSDGSDSIVFNFDGVDWTLPWADCERCFPAELNVSTGLSDGFLTHTTPTFQAPPHYLETRDCPDGIIDIEEGWRWLCERGEKFSLSFVVTPGKKWKGTGVHSTTRKWKAPIPSLMANAMAEDEQQNPERYLLKQDARVFDAFKSVATPVHVNIALLQDMEFTLVELLSYFPSHYQWRKGGDRLARSGMSASDITNFINMSRCLPGQSHCKRSSAEDYVFSYKTENGTKVKVVPAQLEATGYTAEQWEYSVWETTDYPLHALTHGLIELPSGPDAGPLTTLIKWCREKKLYKALLSDVPTLLHESGIGSLIEPSYCADPDQEVLSRHSESIRKDRLRVLREVKAFKEREEDKAHEGQQSKKRKLR